MIGLKEIENDSVNLVFADPPYNLIGLDIFVDGQVYRKWSIEYFKEIKRILKWNGSFILCGRPPILCQLVSDLIDMGFVFREWITWHKVDSITPAKEYHSNNYECFAIFSKWTERVFNHIPIKSKTDNYSSERNIGSIWEHCKISSNHKEGTKHPTQKPIKFLERFVQTYSNPNDLVIDLFSGSGTTAVACKTNNRKFIGFEINPEYIKMSDERLIQQPLEFVKTTSNEKGAKE
jgi:DNA modification methylase